MQSDMITAALVCLFTVAAILAAVYAAALAAVETVKEVSLAALILAAGYGFAVLILSL